MRKFKINSANNIYLGSAKAFVLSALLANNLAGDDNKKNDHNRSGGGYVHNATALAGTHSNSDTKNSTGKSVKTTSSPSFFKSFFGSSETGHASSSSRGGSSSTSHGG